MEPAAEEPQPEIQEAPLEPAPAAEVAEPPVEEVPPVESLEAEEELPELPSWLEGEVAEAPEELEWTPPPIRPLSPVELNRASLVELERLPGVGFIMAQQIIAYRDQYGPFKQVEDLLQVPDFSRSTLHGIQEWIFIELPEEPPEPVVETYNLQLPEEDGTSPEITSAHQAVSSGDLDQALQTYASLIRANRSLETIIRDLQEVLAHSPENLNAWQCLGDAYLRTNQIQLALEAYVKAEQLLR